MLQSMGVQRVGHNLATEQQASGCLFTSPHSQVRKERGLSHLVCPGLKCSRFHILILGSCFLKIVLVCSRLFPLCVCAKSHSHVQLFVAHTLMGFPRQKYWSGLPFPPPGDLSDPGIEPVLLHLLHGQVDSFTAEPPGKPLNAITRGRKLKSKETYVYIWMIHVDIVHKLAHYCQGIIPQLKINTLKFFKKEMSRGGLKHRAIWKRDT